jgi:hypothetical protein
LRFNSQAACSFADALSLRQRMREARRIFKTPGRRGWLWLFGVIRFL